MPSCRPALPAGRFAQMYDYSTNNRSFYDGINLQLRKRMSSHFMFQVSDVISWSRAWGGYPVASYGGSGLAITPQQQFAPDEFNYTNFDERNRFVASGVFNLPWGFSISPIFTAASARPYSFIAGSDVNGDGRHALDRVCVGSTLADPVTTLGCDMIKPNTLRGIPYIDMNMRVDKSFALGERAQLLLYWEFYNLFNRANFCNSYEENSASSSFNTPQSYCNGPSNSAYAGISGYGAAAIASFSNQFGLRIQLLTCIRSIDRGRSKERPFVVEAKKFWIRSGIDRPVGMKTHSRNYQVSRSETQELRPALQRWVGVKNGVQSRRDGRPFTRKRNANRTQCPISSRGPQTPARSSTWHDAPSAYRCNRSRPASETG